MGTIEIDGKKVSFEGGKMVLQVAQENGIEIPSYCYHPGLSIVASCRICLGEVEMPDPKNPGKLVRVPKLVPTCQTPAVDGMKVYTQSDKSRANQRAVMEFLLINHPLDCPVCDQAGECDLQDYSYKYGRSESRFLEDKAKKPKKDIGEHVLLYSDRCIMCTRCVRFTREISGTSELGVFGRGHKEEIDVFPGRPLNNPLSGNVIDLCPVGALLDKDFLFTQRVWFLKSTPSISPTSSGGENIDIHHNEGRIYRIKPRYNKDVNQWWISDETRYSFKFVHAANRLRTPEAKKDGQFAEIGWNKAYEQLADILKSAVQTAGPGSTAIVVSPFDATEEIYLQIKYARSIDPQAWLVIQPVPVVVAGGGGGGQEEVFRNPETGQVTYTIKAEKCPNRWGLEKMLSHFGGNTCTLEDLAFKKITAALVSADPVLLPDADFTAFANIPTIIRLGTASTDLYQQATLSLPTVTWAEKSGVYENFEGRVQPFMQAIPPLGDSRSTGQIFWNLLGNPTPYNPATIRTSLATTMPEYATILEPMSTVKVKEMQFTELN
ncbi:MAG: molybdopterin-dependent oxidoreductase [Phycisphaerales bacterium]|nr:molybdopterin-dependent oxidoreductase [Phycisphaerales bacterium]